MSTLRAPRSFVTFPRALLLAALSTAAIACGPALLHGEVGDDEATGCGTDEGATGGAKAGSTTGGSRAAGASNGDGGTGASNGTSTSTGTGAGAGSNAGGNAGGTTGGASTSTTSACSAVGSCLYANSFCQETSTDSATLRASYDSTCRAANGTPSTGTCSHANAVAGCEVDGSQPGTCVKVTTWYFAPQTAATIATLCNAARGRLLTP